MLCSSLTLYSTARFRFLSVDLSCTMLRNSNALCQSSSVMWCWILSSAAIRSWSRKESTEVLSLMFMLEEAWALGRSGQWCWSWRVCGYSFFFVQAIYSDISGEVNVNPFPNNHGNTGGFPVDKPHTYPMLVVYMCVYLGLCCWISLENLLCPNEVNVYLPRLLVWSGLAGY